MKLTSQNTYSAGWQICSWCRKPIKMVWLSRLWESHGICTCCAKGMLK